MFASGGSVYDTATGTRRDVRQSRFARRGVLAQLPLVVGRGRQTVGRRRDAWHGRHQQHGHDGRAGRPLHRRTPPPGWSSRRRPPTRPASSRARDGCSWRPGLPSSHLLAVDLRTGAIERLDASTSPPCASTCSGGSTGVTRWPRCSRATRRTSPCSTCPDADVESNLAATIDDAGTDSTFSFATDLASVDHPTRDFSGPRPRRRLLRRRERAPRPVADAGDGAGPRPGSLAGLAAAIARPALAVAGAAPPDPGRLTTASRPARSAAAAA